MPVDLEAIYEDALAEIRELRAAIERKDAALENARQSLHIFTDDKKLLLAHTDEFIADGKTTLQHVTAALEADKEPS